MKTILTDVKQLKIKQNLTVLTNQELSDEFDRFREIIKQVQEGKLITSPKSEVGIMITAYARALNEEREARFANFLNNPEVQEELARLENKEEPST